MEAQMRTSLIMQENVTAKLQEEIDNMKNEPTDIHMLAVYYLVKAEGKSWLKSKAAILSVLLSFIVVAVQVIISGYLTLNIITPTCFQDDDCPEGNYCLHDYNIYGERMSEHGNCIGECYYHNKFGRLHFLDPYWNTFLQEPGCKDENDTLCIENIPLHRLRKFCEEDLETSHDFIKDRCLRSVHCKDPDLQLETRVCNIVKVNRDVLDFMGVFILTVVGILLVLKIFGDIASGRKQLAYLRSSVAPSLLKQICSSSIIVSSTYLPFLAVQATVALMFFSPMLPQNIVLNALSVAFILEIDNVVGIFALKALKIEEESIRQKFEYKKENKGVEKAMEFFIIGTCFVLFMYQILEVGNDRLKIGYSLTSFILNMEGIYDFRSCVGIMFNLLGTFFIVMFLFFLLNVLIALYDSCKAESRFKIWQIFVWRVLTSLSASFLCFFFVLFPLALEAIVGNTEKYKVGPLFFSAVKSRENAAIAAAVCISIFAFLTLLMWQMEKRLIVVDDDMIINGNEENFDENQYPSPKARTYFSRTFVAAMTKKQKIYAAAVVISLSIIVGLLGGLLPRNATCPFTKVEDCSQFKKDFPDCNVEKPILIGDDKCNGGEYNTAECNYDNGDCLEFNAKYPNCTVEFPYFIGDGFCHGDVYNTEECNWDDGDCLEVNEKYPNCFVSMYIVSCPDCGWCDEESLNYSLQCGWDFGNCVPPESYLCTVDGDRVWDGEKCLDFDEVYPNCKVHEPGRIGDGTCDEGEYNTEECNFDGGDCDLSDGFICLKEESLTWDESRAVALEMNADLVKIECKEQNLKVFQVSNSAPVWIGVKRDEDGQWTYADGSGDVGYVNWSLVQYSDEDCVAFGPGGWYKAPCSNEAFKGSAVYQSSSQIDGMNCVSYPQCPPN